MDSKLNSTDKVLVILKAFLPDNPPRGISELCNELGMKPATASRILSILKKHGFIEQNANRKYQLGEVITALGKAKGESRTAGLVALVEPHLKRVNRILKESIQLELFSDKSVKIAVIVPGTKTVRLHLPIEPGVNVGVHATAGSKAIIAFLSSERLEDIIKAHPELEAFRPNTITDWKVLKQQLEQIRETGLAYDFNEYEEDVCAVGTPIFDHANEVIGAVSVAVPRMRDTMITEQTTIDLLKETAQNITSALGDLSPK